jgi:two-component system nitrate/nitrite response regulator NarL
MSASREKISLVVADDHPFVLQGIVHVIEADPELMVGAKGPDGLTALNAIREHQPAVAVLDITMPGLTGLEILARLNAEGSPTKVIFLTANATDAHILDLIEGGASALVMKDAAIDELGQCIKKVANGERHFPSDLVAKAVERETGRRSGWERVEKALSPREREIMMLVAEGLPNKEIARRLDLSEGTVRIHVHNIYQKTGIASRAALTALAVTNKDLQKS